MAIASMKCCGYLSLDVVEIKEKTALQAPVQSIARCCLLLSTLGWIYYIPPSPPLSPTRRGGDSQLWVSRYINMQSSPDKPYITEVPQYGPERRVLCKSHPNLNMSIEKSVVCLKDITLRSSLSHSTLVHHTFNSLRIELPVIAPWATVRIRVLALGPRHRWKV